MRPFSYCRLVCYSALLLALVLAVRADKAPDRPKELEPECHVVALAKGYTRTGETIHGERAKVTVRRPGKRVTLVLSCYNQTTWIVTAEAGTRLEKVVLCGYHRQAVTGVPRDVEVVEVFHEGRRGKYFYFGGKPGSAEFRSAARDLKPITGLEILSFQNGGSAKPDAPIVVDQVQGRPELASDYPRPTDPAKLPKLSYQAIHFTPGALRGQSSAALADFTLGGPKADTRKLLPRDVVQVTFDPAAKKYYGLASHEVYEIDLDRGAAQQMDMGLDVPRLSWPCGIAFDSRRQRLLVVSLGGRGHLYACSMATGKWAVLADMKNVDLSALAYDAKADALYGIEAGRPNEPRPMLIRYNSDGNEEKRIALPAPMLPGMLGRGGPDKRVQMIAVDGQLIVLVAPGLGGDEERHPESLIYLIDPKAEKVWLTSKQ